VHSALLCQLSCSESLRLMLTQRRLFKHLGCVKALLLLLLLL